MWWGLSPSTSVVQVGILDGCPSGSLVSCLHKTEHYKLQFDSSVGAILLQISENCCVLHGLLIYIINIIFLIRIDLVIN